jgi:hypothetical protein
MPKTPESQEPQPRSYIQRVYYLLEENGVVMDYKMGVSGWGDMGDTNVVNTMFTTATDYPPESQFGQFLQLVIAENRFAERLSKYVSKFPQSATVQERQRILMELRKIRKLIGTELFGEEEGTFATQLTDVIKAGSPKLRGERFGAVLTAVRERIPPSRQ